MTRTPPDPQTTGEFDLIARYFRPLAAGNDAALDLRDDAAVIRPEAGEDMVTTADALVANVHFLSDDAPQDIAWKALAVNLSDLAGMGARPLGYLLTVAWPRGIGEGWVAAFADGLKSCQTATNTSLLGGDTVSTDGPLTVSVTAIGTVPMGQALLRRGARPGDGVFVTGTIGDGALGLMVARKTLDATISDEHRAALLARYRRPIPRLEQAARLLGHASAALDISDGLIADAEHIARESGVAIVLDATAVPLSHAARAAIEQSPELMGTILTGGDDYELLFTAPDAGTVDGTRIGRVDAADSGTVRVEGADGAALAFDRGGFRHF